MSILKIMKVDNNARIPCRAHEGDAGLDLYSCEEVEILPGYSKLVGTGISIELPPDTEAQIRPRSGLALSNQITVLNSPGTIDNGYRGEIKIILINHGKEVFKVLKGMKIAQMVINPIIYVEVADVTELSATQRGSDGFGSTGE